MRRGARVWTLAALEQSDLLASKPKPGAECRDPTTRQAEAAFQEYASFLALWRSERPSARP